MAAGTIERPNDKAVFYYFYSLGNHAVTKQSTAGVYYSQTELDVAREGLDPIGCFISYWSNISANFTPYITSSNKLGFMSDVSQTLGEVGVIITYRES